MTFNEKFAEEDESRLDHMTNEREGDFESVIEDLRELSLDTTDDDDEAAPDWPDDEYARTVSIHFPRAASACHGTAGIEISIHEILTLVAAAHPETAERLLAIRDGFYSDQEEDFADSDVSGDTWGPHGPEQRAEARIAHAMGAAARLVRRAEIEAEFKRDEAEAARKEAEEAAKWAPFAEECAVLKEEEEANFDRADELDLKWERFVIERETWGDARATLENERRAELEAEGDSLLKDQEAWWERRAELTLKVEKSWAVRPAEPLEVASRG